MDELYQAPAKDVVSSSCGCFAGTCLWSVLCCRLRRYRLQTTKNRSSPAGHPDLISNPQQSGNLKILGRGAGWRPPPASVRSAGVGTAAAARFRVERAWAVFAWHLQSL